MADKLFLLAICSLAEIQYSGLQGQCQFFCKLLYTNTALVMAGFISL